MSFAWTDELDAKIRRLYVDETRSASEISAMIGATSRNAVIGRLNRIGAKRDRATSLAVSRRLRPRSTSTPSPKPVAFQPSRTPPPVHAAPAPEGGVKPPAAFRAHASTAPEKACTLVHLDLFRSCKWPISPPHVDGADMLFCGAQREEGSSYCPGHRALSGTRQRTEAEREQDAKRAEAMRLGRQRADRDRRAG